jgi:hypothetical protein
VRFIQKRGTFLKEVRLNLSEVIHMKRILTILLVCILLTGCGAETAEELAEQEAAAAAEPVLAAELQLPASGERPMGGPALCGKHRV